MGFCLMDIGLRCLMQTMMCNILMYLGISAILTVFSFSYRHHATG